LSMSGPMDISLRGKGSVNNPLMEGTIAWRNGTLAGLPVDRAKCEINLENGLVKLENLTATRKKGYQLTGKISFGTELQGKEEPDAPQFDLVIQNGDLALLRDVWEDVTKAKGSFEGHLKLHQNFEGSLAVKD